MNANPALLSCLSQVVAMMLTMAILPRMRMTSLFGAGMLVTAIAIVNIYFWDSSLFFSLPEQVNQRSLVLLLVNGGIFWVLVKVLPGVEIDGLLPAILAPLVFTVLTVLVKHYAPLVDWAEVSERAATLLHELSQSLKVYFQGGERTGPAV